jgi:hypothetical protein
MAIFMFGMEQLGQALDRLLDQQGHKVQKDHRVQQVMMVLRVQKDHKVYKVLKEQKVLKGQKVHRVQQETMVHKA